MFTIQNFFFTELSERNKLIFLSFCGFAIVYAMRVNLSVAIVAMIEPKSAAEKIQAEKVIGSDDSCPVPLSSNKNKVRFLVAHQIVSNINYLKTKVLNHKK